MESYKVLVWLLLGKISYEALLANLNQKKLKEGIFLDLIENFAWHILPITHYPGRGIPTLSVIAINR